MHHHARRFVNHNHLRVFIQNIQRDRLGFQAQGSIGRNGHHNAIARFHLPMLVGAGRIIHLHLARFNQLLKARSRQIGPLSRQEAIEPLRAIGCASIGRQVAFVRRFQFREIHPRVCRRIERRIERRVSRWISRWISR